jgi:hypothetical protein
MCTINVKERHMNEIKLIYLVPDMPSLIDNGKTIPNIVNIVCKNLNNVGLPPSISPVINSLIPKL